MATETAPVVTAKKPKVTKPKGDKKPTTQALIKEAILALKERSGSSPAAIKKYISSKTTVDSSLLSRELKKLTTKGVLVKVKASYKLSESAKKAPAMPKKKVVKKTTAAKPKKATGAAKPKKTPKKAVKKPAAAEGAAVPKVKKPATKKPAAKKPATKKPAAKKPTAAKKPKTAAKKPAVKKAPTKKAAPKKTPAKKTTKPKATKPKAAKKA